MCSSLSAQESRAVYYFEPFEWNRSLIAKPRWKHNLVIKTNALALAGTIANIGAEVTVGSSVSIDLPLYYSPYDLAKGTKFRILSLRPSVRYWFCCACYGGWFLGAGAQATWFNIATGGALRYQDNRAVLGVGVTAGYAWYFSCHFGMEASLGAGYASVSYDTFENVPNGAYTGSRKRNYWGLTDASISLFYRF